MDKHKKSETQSHPDINQTHKNEYKSLPLNRVVYVNIDDEVATIYDQILKKKHNHIYFVVPNRADLFQSIINLKILKRKSTDIGKEIILVTTDENGKYFAQKSQIDCYENIQDITGERKVKPKPVPKENIIQVSNQKIINTQEVLSESQNASDQDIEEVSAKTKFNLSDYIENKINSTKQEFTNFIYTKIPRLDPKNQKFIVTKPNKNLIFAISFTSVFLLFFVAYISLPNSVVTITPNFVANEQKVNITLADNERHQNWLRTTTNKAVPMYKISPGLVEHTITFNPTGYDLDGQNAQGEVTVYNTSNQDYGLLPFTRFQTDNGIIVRSKRFINVPAGSPDNPSTATVEVVADALDINRIPIGERGNLSSQTRLILPGLRANTQNQVYAIVEKPLSGGVTSKDRIVTENDLIAAEQLSLEELRRQYSNKLTEYINQYNSDHNLNLRLFNNPITFQIRDEQSLLDKTLLGKKMQSFNITARANIEGYAYDHQEFTNILVRQLRSLQTPDKELAKIDTDSIQMNILDTLNQDSIRTKLAEGFIEVTATITGIEKFILDPNSSSGKILINKILQNITSLEIDAAKRYVQSLPEIDKVDISTWPFWAPTLPNKPENIKIEINEQNISKS